MLHGELMEVEKISKKMPGHVRKMKTRASKSTILKNSSFYENRPEESSEEKIDANVKERIRTHSVNSAMSTLRTLIPTEPANRKLSKIEILRLACSYIEHLGTTLVYGPGDDHPCLLRNTLGSRDGDLNDATNQSSPKERSVCTFCLANIKRANKASSRQCYSSANNCASEQQQQQPQIALDKTLWEAQNY